MRKSQGCDCKDWEPGTKAINGPIALQQLRAGQPLPADYFIPWNFCPWCGAALHEEQVIQDAKRFVQRQ